MKMFRSLFSGQRIESLLPLCFSKQDYANKNYVADYGIMQLLNESLCEDLKFLQPYHTFHLQLWKKLETNDRVLRHFNTVVIEGLVI